MKKIITICLACLLSFQLIGCGGDSGSGAASSSAALAGNEPQVESASEQAPESSLVINSPDEKKDEEETAAAPALEQAEEKKDAEADESTADADTDTDAGEQDAQTGEQDAKTGEQADNAGEKQDGVVGVWKLIDMSQGGKSVYTREQAEETAKMGIVAYIDFHEDGTVMTMFGEESNGTWDDSSIIVNETAVAYTLDGGTLTLKGNDDSTMTFERSSQDEINSILGYKDGVLDESVIYAEGEQTLVDTDKLAVTITGYSADQKGFVMKLRCENKTENPVIITSGSFVINGYLIEPKWASNLEAGASKESELTASIADLEKCGITAVDEIRITFKAIDSTSYEKLLSDKDEIAVYPTGKTAEEITVPKRTPAEGETVLIDNEYCTFIIQGVDTNPLLGYGVNCYFENKTDHALTMLWEKASLNGQEAVSYFAKELLPNIRGYDQGLFLTTTLDELNLKGEDISEIGFTLRVYDSSTGSIQTVVEEPFTYQVPAAQ